MWGTTPVNCFNQPTTWPVSGPPTKHAMWLISKNGAKGGTHKPRRHAPLREIRGHCGADCTVSRSGAPETAAPTILGLSVQPHVKLPAVYTDQVRMQCPSTPETSGLPYAGSARGLQPVANHKRRCCATPTSRSAEPCRIACLHKESDPAKQHVRTAIQAVLTRSRSAGDRHAGLH